VSDLKMLAKIQKQNLSTLQNPVPEAQPLWLFAAETAASMSDLK